MVVQGVYSTALAETEQTPGRSTVGTSAGYFSADYFTARSRFREMVEAAGGRLESLELDAKGPGNENLSIDIGWFGAENPRRVLVHSSGLHGVEGFAGSAIQLQLLDNLPTIPPDAALVLVHTLNPYGMAWLRRFNESNVDLNRNFLGDEKYGGAPEVYFKVNSFLNPQSPPSRDFYLLKAGWLILRHGFSTLKQAVAGGQYEYPKGLFFGGKRLEQGPEKYQSFIAQRLASAEQLVAIDVHTGLGEYGEDTLLVESNDYDSVRQMFGERVAPLSADESPAYATRGGLKSMYSFVSPEARTYALTQEFGTYGPIRVLHALREENRWHHYGQGTVDHLTKQKLKKTFCPEDESWRLSVLMRGKEVLRQAVELSFFSP